MRHPIDFVLENKKLTEDIYIRVFIMIQKLKENLEVTQLSLMSNSKITIKSARLFQVSPDGLYINLERKNLPSSLKKDLNLDSLLNKEIAMNLSIMNIQLNGLITNARYTGGGVFEIFVQFLNNTPRYWYDCLMDVIVSYPYGEFSNIELFSSHKLDH